METPDDVPSDEMAEFLSLQTNDRLWLRAALPLVQLATKVDAATTHERVRHAVNDMAIAACERAARIFRSDLPPLGCEDSGDPDDA